MLFRHGLCWLSVLMFVAGAPAWVLGQEKNVGLIIQVEATAEAEIAKDADDDDDDADEEAEVKQEVTVIVKQDGKKTTVTQTVAGEFVGEIVTDDVKTAVKAKSLAELKEQFPEAHAAFVEKPANPGAKPGVPANVNVQMTNINGARKVEATEPGRKIVMRDQQGKQLEITVQRDLEHGTRTERYDAPHFDALRKVHPEIAQLVKQYRDGAIGFGGNVNLQVQNLPGRIVGGFGGQQPQIAGPRKIVGEHDGQRVVIRDENGMKIKLTLTKTVDGKDVTEEFTAETYGELKKNHPEIVKIYDKLAGKGQPQAQNQVNGIVIGNAVPIQIQVQAQAVPVQAIPEAPVPLPVGQGQDLQIAKRLLQQSQQRLQRLAADPKFADAEAVKKISEEIAATAKKLEELEAKAKAKP